MAVRNTFSNLDGEPWLVGKDITEILGYVNASKAVSVHVSEEDRVLKTLEADAQNGNVVSSKVPFGYFFIYHCSELRYWLNYKHIFRGCTSTTSEINNNKQRS